jgi:hypothetical protein
VAEPTDIEKKSLEAHVELCAERYRFLESRLTNIDDKIEKQSIVIREVHDMIQSMGEKRSDQVMTWSIGIVAVLLGIIGYLLSVYVIK